MDLGTALRLSAAGMDVPGTRRRVIAEAVADAEITGGTPGADPGRRNDVTFANRTPNRASRGDVLAMRTAQGADSANLSVMRVTRAMLSRTIELLR